MKFLREDYRDIFISDAYDIPKSGWLVDAIDDMNDIQERLQYKKRDMSSDELKKKLENIIQSLKTAIREEIKDFDKEEEEE